MAMLDPRHVEINPTMPSSDSSDTEDAAPARPRPIPQPQQDAAPVRPRSIPQQQPHVDFVEAPLAIEDMPLRKRAKRTFICMYVYIYIHI